MKEIISVNKKVIDPNKPTYAMVVFNYHKANYLFGYLNDTILNGLQKDHNVVIVAITNKKDLAELESKYYNVLSFDLDHYKDNYFKRSKEYEGEGTHFDYNAALTHESFDRVLGDYNISKVIIGNETLAVLPSTGHGPGEYGPLKERFFDYVGKDQAKVEEINTISSRLSKKINGMYNVLAYNYWMKNLTYNFVKYCSLKEHYEMTYFPVIDPKVFHLGYTLNDIPCTMHYFADDNRGTREYTQFPISEMQHLIYEDLDLYNGPKTKDFVFYGTILNTNGPKITRWNQYLRNLNLESADYFIPLRFNGLFATEKEANRFKGKLNEKSLNSATETQQEIYASIRDHKSYSGHFYPDKQYEICKDYKYTLIVCCGSFEDSLNYRPVFSAIAGMLPFIDPQFDPEYLYIPKKIQDKLRVNSEKDIQDKISYYNTNDTERLSLLQELRDLFDLDNFKKNFDVQQFIKKHY